MDNINVFYSFHYEDVGNFKANIIRNSTRFKCYKGLLTDRSIWEEFKAKNITAIKNRIENSGLIDSDATIVLIGQKTFSRRWVKYEIIKSFEFGNTLIGIHINRLKGKEGVISKKGLNPFNRLGFFYEEESDILKFYELQNRSWRPFKDLPFVENAKKNSVYVKKTNFFQKLIGNKKDGKFYKLSDFFNEYTWIKGEHNAKTLHAWIIENQKKIKI